MIAQPHQGVVASGGLSNESAFAGNPESAARERLRSTPASPSASIRLPRHVLGRPTEHVASFDSDGFVESVAPVQALGQLPQDASALQVSTTVGTG